MWTPDSWQTKRLEQQPDYQDRRAFNSVINELNTLPPLVSPKEVARLKELNAKASRGEAFILQAGDCAESFADCNQISINRKLQVILQMSALLMYSQGKPVVQIGRMAGQYAKPRSAHTETKAGLSLPCYRGDLINDIEFSKAARTADPSRLLKGYSLASLTLNYIRAFGSEQVKTFLQPDAWTEEKLLGLSNSRYAPLIQPIQQSMTMLGHIQQYPHPFLSEFFTCHEALHLHYEQALTRQQQNGEWYNLSTHLPWVGMRTAKPDSAHIEYLRGITNPVAIKVGPRMSSNWLLEICQALNPDNQAGKLMLITRLGVDRVQDKLPELIRHIQSNKLNVTWCCDPMHGNTVVTDKGQKTRPFESIVKEMQETFEIHQALNSCLGGLHLELTGDHVVECTGGVHHASADDVKTGYRSLVDPRLNPSQAIELLLQLVLSQHKRGVSLQPDMVKLIS
ncbi:3-deoxy-7-phosphoheptulonate synthase class II [Pleionea sp. CnH1-48]|uniref:3-deoxy-7-phosphoheptulonate synthase class II n=1 Tax=Pleionea sp. CnH1-48 TaxID=2954494 RepID=UPI00209824B7|nr:3-deoxy-7-phosphoheptulonate synthase class II [Pleionea sp. CnH1-48]MCO7225718.1 3-deoxy-7-phosphoheptulonate synthase [Pleionea sp. CnH1-48]